MQTNQEVQPVNGNRDIALAGGLNIHYELDLTKVVTEPTRPMLEILERLTGLKFTDIEIEDQPANQPIPNRYSRIEEWFAVCCTETAGDERVRLEDLYDNFSEWMQGYGNELVPRKGILCKVLVEQLHLKKKRFGGRIYFLGLALVEGG